MRIRRKWCFGARATFICRSLSTGCAAATTSRSAAGPAAVPYKETIRSGTQQHSRFKRQSGGHGQFADVTIEVKTLPRGSGFTFTDSVVGGAIPRNYIPSVEEGVTEALRRGPLGFPVVDVAVNLITGQFHAVDSSDQAFKTAGRQAVQESLPKCEPVLLEPIDLVEISVPNAFTARVQRLISGRRSQILGYDAKPDWPGWDVVSAHHAAKRAARSDRRAALADIGDRQLRPSLRSYAGAVGAAGGEGARHAHRGRGAIAATAIPGSRNRDLAPARRAPTSGSSRSGGPAMLIRRKRGWELRDTAATPEAVFLGRRELLKAAAAGSILAPGLFGRLWRWPPKKIPRPRSIRPSRTRATRSIVR